MHSDDLKDDYSRPFIVDNMKNVEFDDSNIMRNQSSLTEEEMKSIACSNKAKDSFYDCIMRIFEQSVSQDLENFHRTKQIEELENNFFLQKCRSNFLSY